MGLVHQHGTRQLLNKLLTNIIRRRYLVVHLKNVSRVKNMNFQQNPTRLSAMEDAVIEEQVNEWMAKGVVRASRLNVAGIDVFTKKQDESYRECIDYRVLSSCVLKDRFPVPLIDEASKNARVKGIHSYGP